MINTSQFNSYPGIALVAVLAILVVLAVLASSFVVVMQIENKSSMASLQD